MKIIIVYGKELPFFFGMCKNLLYGNFLLFLYVRCGENATITGK